MGFDKKSYINDIKQRSAPSIMVVMKRPLVLVALVSALVLGFFSFGFAEGKVFNKDYSGIKSIEATIETHEGKIVLALDFKAAPNTVANFVDLANKGFYNGNN